MSWQNVNSRMKDMVDSYFIDLERQEECRTLIDIVTQEFPTIDTKQVEEAIKLCKQCTLPPRSRYTVVTWLERNMKLDLRETGSW